MLPSRKRGGLAVAALLAMFSMQAQAQGTYSFPNTAVGSTAATVAIPVTLPNGGTVSTVRVLTGGVAALDYTDTGAGNCAGASLMNGQSCTVSVSFTPKAPGERRGAIVLLDSHGVLLGTKYLYAVAQGPVGVMVPGIISTIAGNGSWIYSGDGMPAGAAQIFLPLSVVVDPAGNFFIADSNNNRVRRVDAASGLISTVAGNGNPGFSGDGGAATSASLNNPSGLALDGAGNLYIADSSNNAVRVVNAATGIITTIAGMGGQLGNSGNGSAATLALLNAPNGLALDGAGNLYIADTGNHTVRVVNAAGTISIFAGDGVAGFGGDGSSAASAALNTPWGVAISASGDLYIADRNNNRIRKVSGGIITTVAGSGAVVGFSGDGQNATLAVLNNPGGVTVDVGGNLYIADSGNNRVRKVNALTGNITTIAGTGTQSVTGDGGPSDEAGLYGPYALALDGAANLYVADMFHNRIRKISSTQSLQMYAAIRVGRVSDPQPQGFENDGNTSLIFTSIQGVTNGAVDAATTTCSTTVSLAKSTACTVGAEFAPTVTGKPVVGSIALVSNAANTPGTITVTGESDALEPTTTTLAASGSTTIALGASITFNSHVTSNGAAPTGSVQFLDGTTVLGTVALNASSSASYTTTALGIGQHSITAVYSGDASSSTSISAILTVTVKQTTATSLTSTTANTVAGTDITFTAKVTAGVAATGSVVFQDGSTAIGNGALDGNGVATFTSNSLTPGPHNITAVYQGDGQSLTSTSAIVKETIQAVTTVVLISSANPSSAGANVHFTATVTAAGAGSAAGTLSGTVTFSEGSTTLGTGVLSAGGVATFDTKTLALGAHTILASYPGATYYASSTSSSITQTVQQAATSSMLASSANPSIVNAAVTLTATVVGTGADPTGAVVFKDGSTQIGSANLDAAGKASITVSTLAVGSHGIVAAYAGDTNNVASSSSVMTQVVQKATSATVLVSTPNPSSQGVFVQFTAVVTSNGTAPTGTVLFQEGTATLGSGTLNASGVATWNTNTLGMGQHTIVAVYQGDTANGTSSSASLTQNVLPATSVGVSSNHNPGTAGASVTFTAVVTGQGAVPTGTITFKDGATLLGNSALNAQGEAVLTISTLNVGSHSITASYAGDAANASSTSGVFVETMQQAASQTVLTASAGSITRGSSVTLTATVTGNGSTPGGNVSFLDNAQPMGTAALNASGVASITSATLTVGQHALTAVYAGDTNDAGSNSTVFTETVSQASPSIQINSSNNPSLAGTGVTLSMVLQNGVATPSGTITWYDGANVLGTSVVNGAASGFTANGLTVGQHSITAAYSGDANNAAITSGVLLQTVQQATSTTVKSEANQSIAGADVHFTATVTGSSGNGVTGSVTFKDGASTLGTGALVNGVAVFDTTTLIVGLHPITAVYSGDSNGQASTSSPWTQSVTAATTVVDLTSSANPSVAGSAVTLTAHVTGNGEAATGTVTFKDGSAVLGTGPINGGIATFIAAALLPGQHILVAQYAGDSNNQAATSAAVTQIVQQRTTTVLTSSANPALTAQAITLTATVSNGSGIAATGTVEFNDGATALGSTALDANGVATLTVNSLTGGQHALAANYNGDTLDIISSSAVLTETVQLRASTTSLASSSNSVTTGDTLTLFAAVQVTGPVAPTGTVTFYAGSTAIGSATLTGTGIATLSYTPAAGSYIITAKYAGDTVYAASTASALGTITVGQATQFKLTPNPSAVSVVSKQFSTIQVTIQSLAGFTDDMQMGCLGLPSGASCTFDATSVTLAAGGSKTVKLTLDTADPLTSGGHASVQVKPSMTMACALPAGVLLGFLLWSVRKNRRALGSLVMLALTVMTIGLGGCGVMQINGVAPGTYNVKVVATGTRTGVTQSANITLTVTQ